MLNSLVTDRIGQSFPQFTIDQVTSLDPHPWSIQFESGHDDGYNPSSPKDSILRTYKNVAWADNYYRQDGLYELDVDFDGVKAQGAFNTQLDNGVLDSFGGSIYEHSDVHTWYYGTITTAPPASYDGWSGAGKDNDGEEAIPSKWYDDDNSPMPSRTTSGFNRTRIAAEDGSPGHPSSNFGAKSNLKFAASVFNGDFSYGDALFNEIPGWSVTAEIRMEI